MAATQKSPLPPVDLSHADVSSSQLNQLKNLLCKYASVFSTHSNDYGRADILNHRIHTGDASPLRQRAYRCSPAVKTEINKQIQALVTNDVIEESHSPWSSPIVMVKKIDGSFRFCVDYRRLNKVTVKDSHPLPRTDDTLDALSGSVYFTTVDLSSGYWQVPMHPDDKEKTAFTTGDGLYQFKVMPMGLTNAPPTFQRLMELVLHGLHWSSCLVYLDDVIVVGRSFSDHMSNLEQVLSRFQRANLKLKPSKCHFLRSEVCFLGHIVSRNGILPDPSNTDRVHTWLTPRNPTEVRSFLGLCSYYRRFVKNFAHIASPLHRLTQKGVPFQWTPECETAFTSLRNALTQPPIVAYPITTKPFILFTDASNTAIGSVLSQVQNGRERVIAYASHVLTAAERRWSTFDRELWAIVWSIRHFRHYLASSSFTVVTDHKPLVGLRKLTVQNDRTGRRSRWALELDPYDWLIIHRDGNRHANADALSRRPPLPKEQDPPAPNLNVQPPLSCQCKPAPPPVCASIHTPIEKGPHAIPPSGPTVPPDISLPQPPTPVDGPDPSSPLLGCNLIPSQQTDPDITQVLTWVTKGSCPSRTQLRNYSPAIRRLCFDFHKLSIIDGILCRHSRPTFGSPRVYQVIIPLALQSQVLSLLHGDPLTGHFSAEKTFQRSLQLCYWPYIRRDIDNHCKTCRPCESRRNPSPRNKAPMQIFNSSRPFQRVFADITQLPKTTKNNQYILVVMDQFTKYVNLYPLLDQTAKSVAQCIFHHYISEHGIPEVLHTDQGRQFESILVQELCKLLGIKKTRTSPYHPQSDGQVERFNRNLKEQLAKYLATPTTAEWDDYLAQVQMAYNSTTHSSTGYSPFYLAKGREPRLPAHILISPPSQHTCSFDSPESYVTSLKSRLASAFDFASDRQNHASSSQKHH